MLTEHPDLQTVRLLFLFRKKILKETIVWQVLHCRESMKNLRMNLLMGKFRYSAMKIFVTISRRKHLEKLCRVLRENGGFQISA